MIFAIICIYRCIYGYWVLSTGWFLRICGKVYFLSFLLIIFLVVSFISMNLFIVNSYIQHLYVSMGVTWILLRIVEMVAEKRCGENV
jgi:hypothetical protein